jgi:hypothetical protein
MACVTRKWAGVDKVWEQKKLEAREMPVKRAESHLSGACIVGRRMPTTTDKLAYVILAVQKYQ